MCRRSGAVLAGRLGGRGRTGHRFRVPLPLDGAGGIRCTRRTVRTAGGNGHCGAIEWISSNSCWRGSPGGSSTDVTSPIASHVVSASIASCALDRQPSECQPRLGSLSYRAWALGLPQRLPHRPRRRTLASAESPRSTSPSRRCTRRASMPLRRDRAEDPDRRPCSAHDDGERVRIRITIRGRPAELNVSLNVRVVAPGAV